MWVNPDIATLTRAGEHRPARVSRADSSDHHCTVGVDIDAWRRRCPYSEAHKAADCYRHFISPWLLPLPPTWRPLRMRFARGKSSAALLCCQDKLREDPRTY